MELCVNERPNFVGLGNHTKDDKVVSTSDNTHQCRVSHPSSDKATIVDNMNLCVND